MKEVIQVHLYCNMGQDQKSKDYLPVFKVKIGDPFPEQELRIENGTYLDLKNQSSQWIVLFFYPQDDSPTCTKQACNLRNGYTELQSKQILLLGVSPDNERKHQRFIQKHQLPYSLVVDEDNKLAKKLGVFGKKKFMGIVYEGVHRTTFVLDKDLKIYGIIYPVVSGKHVEQIIHLTPGPAQWRGARGEV
ncbi:MAG: peroxiredoxin [Saprospiraceae bacterium]|nr:peroxiredoxin [Saprospiraceae bacterium]